MSSPPSEVSAIDLYLQQKCPLPLASQRLVEIGTKRTLAPSAAWFTKVYRAFKGGGGLVLPKHLLLLAVREPHDEAISCFVLGRFLPSIAMSAAAVEAALAYELQVLGVDFREKEWEKVTLGGLLNRAKRRSIGLIKEGSGLDFDISELNRMRIKALHFPDVKRAEEVTEEVFHWVMGSDGTPPDNAPAYVGVTKRMAMDAIVLMDRVLDSLWPDALEAEFSTPPSNAGKEGKGPGREGPA